MYLLNFAEFLEFDMRIGYIERQVPSAVINIYINFHASVYTISSVEAAVQNVFQNRCSSKFRNIHKETPVLDVMISSHRIPPCVYSFPLPSTSLGKGEAVDEESNGKWHRKEGVQSKKWFRSYKFFYVLFSVTQSLFVLGFSRSPDNITASNKKSTSKKEPSSVSEITI